MRDEEERRSYPSSRRQALLREGQEETLHSSSFHGGSMQCFAVEQGSSSALGLLQQRVPLQQSQIFLANGNLLIEFTILL